MQNKPNYKKGKMNESSVIKKDYENSRLAEKIVAYLFPCNGEGGIRTRGTLKSTPVFETGSLSRSDTSPENLFAHCTCIRLILQED